MSLKRDLLGPAFIGAVSGAAVYLVSPTFEATDWQGKYNVTAEQAAQLERNEDRDDAINVGLIFGGFALVYGAGKRAGIRLAKRKEEEPTAP